MSNLSSNTNMKTLKLSKMINQYEVPAYLVDELPEIEKELKTFSPTLNIFKTIQCLANYTKAKVIEHDMLLAKKCFAAADNIYVKGNSIVKNAVENVFIYSLSMIIGRGNSDEKKQLQAIMPICLYMAYVQQVLRPGI